MVLRRFSLFPGRGVPYVSKLRSERFTCIADELAKGHYDIVSLQEVRSVIMSWSATQCQYLSLHTNIQN